MAPAPIQSWAPGSFLARLPADQAAALLRLGARRQFDPGRTLMREGERSTHVELILRGFVKISSAVDGTEVLLDIRIPGDFVGELAGFIDRPRTATATACGRVHSTVVSKGDFHRFLYRSPEATMTMAAVMGERLRWANERRGLFAACPVEVRLARILVELTLSCGRRGEDGVRIDVPLSQPELATMIGVSEATIQKVIRELRELGIIRTGYRRIVVTDLPALRAYGGEPDDWALSG